MTKRFLSLFLSFLLILATVFYPNGAFTKTVLAAYPGDSVTTTLPDGSSYTYIEDGAYKTYDETDPQSMILFSSSRVYNWLPKDADGDGSYDHWNYSGNSCSADSITGGTMGSFDFKAQNNSIDYEDLDVHVRYKSGDFSTNGYEANAAEQLVLDYWGVTRMVGIQMLDPTPGDDSFPGVGGDTAFDYYYNMQINLNKYVDLTKYTHLYFDFWVSSDYTIRTPGQLNIVLCDSTYSKNDGFEYNVDFSKLKPDADGKINTSHRLRWDLRGLSTGGSGISGLNINHINTITLRYMTPTSNKTQYNSGKTPKIWIGKFVAYTEIDNWHPGATWYDSSGVNYEGIAGGNPDAKQSTIIGVVGQNRWNTSIKVMLPMFADFDGYRIIGLDWGDQSTSTLDYQIGALDRWTWRWQRQDTTSASATSGDTFPELPLTGGGGAWGQGYLRRGGKWLSHSTYRSFNS